MKRLILSLWLLALLAAQLPATDYTSNATGDWSTSTIWTPNGTPGNGDTITVASGHTVTVDSNRTIGTSPAAGTDVITLTGNLTVGTGVTLTVRGDTQVNNTGDIVLNAGATWKFDATQAAAPTTTNYRIELGSGHYANLVTITCNGTSGSHCAFTSDTTGGAARGMIDGPYITGSMVCTWTDFSEIGTTTKGLYLLRESQEVNTFDDCTFDNCGPVRMFTNQGGGIMRFRRCTFTNTLGSYAIETTSDSTATEYLFEDCVFADDVPQFIGLGPTVRRCYFNKVFSGSTSTDIDVFEDNMCCSYGDSTNYTLYMTLCEDTIFFRKYVGATGNPHYVAPNTDWTSDLTIQGCIFQNGDEGAGGDCITSPGNNASYGVIAKNNLYLPNSNGNSSGTVMSFQGGVNTKAAVLEHNTVYVGAYIYTGETYDGHTGIIGSYKSNLVVDAPYLIYEETPTVTDMVSSANADYNGTYSVADPYDSLTFSAGSPDANGVTGDPRFVDSTRGVATYDTAGLGNSVGTAWAHNTSYSAGDVRSITEVGYYEDQAVNFRCLTNHTSDQASDSLGKPGVCDDWWQTWELQTLYRLRENTARIPLMHTWIREGFRPRALAFRNAGHDNVTIGAMEGDWTMLRILYHHYRRLRR